jgi:hypothetical protein
MLIDVGQIKAAPSLLRWEQYQLAKRSGVAISTIRRLEGLKSQMGARFETVVRFDWLLRLPALSFLPRRTLACACGVSISDQQVCSCEFFPMQAKSSIIFGANEGCADQRSVQFPSCWIDDG